MKLNRRNFLKLAPLLFTGGIIADALAIEPNWIRLTHLDFRHIGAKKKIIHFSDFHFKGNRFFADRVINKINKYQPDIVVFTGDIVENKNKKYLPEALEYITQIKYPTFGIFGNHDPKNYKSIQKFKQAFKSTGGDFFINEKIDLGSFVLHGAYNIKAFDDIENKPKILLCHYPIVGNKKIEQPYDLVLCGHSHGGQVRFPFIGAPVLPPAVGRYVKGLYQSNIGPLYVNVGVGTFFIPVRFFCPPEITVIQI